GFEGRGAEVAEIVLVADIGVVAQGAPAVADPAFMGHAAYPAILALVGQAAATGGHFAADVAAVVVPPVAAGDRGVAPAADVAELRLEHGAPLLHEARGQGGVVVGGEVQVQGLGVIDAVVVARHDHRVEQAAGAVVGHGEADPGDVEQRPVLDLEADVLGGGDAPHRVDDDIRRLQLPGGVARFAGGVGGAVHVNEVVVALLEVLGGAPRAAAV